MFSFFTQLEIYSLLSIRTIRLAVIMFAKKMLSEKDISKKIYDLLGYFRSISFYSDQIMPKSISHPPKYARMS